MALPTVSLIGRPNVGKSTLFNRIVRRREAIVHDQPGVTRDRKYMRAEWAGRDFMLIDTGGFVPNSEDKIEKAVVAHAQDAIAESDVVVFLVDAKTGLTALDLEIGRLLQRGGKRVLLAVNKVDSTKAEPHAAEFYRLGLGEQVMLSAISGRQVGDFLEAVVALLPPESGATDVVDDPALSLAVVGRPNVGKSSFVNAILGREKNIVTDIPGTTRDAIDTRFKFYAQEFLLIDTAGLRRKARVTESVEFYSTVRSMQSLQRCDVAIVIVDATRGVESQDLHIIQEGINLNKGLILAINKWDLVEKDTQTAREYELNIRDRLKNTAYIPVIFISALTKQRIFKVIELAIEVNAERKKKITTSVLNNFLSEVIRRNPPPSMDQREVKINYVTQVKSGPPVFAFFCNAPRSVKSNYRSYLENRMRERFGFTGVPLTFLFRRK